MTNTLAIIVLLSAPFTLCTANENMNAADNMQKRDGLDGLGMQPFQMSPQMGGGQLSMAAPQAQFMQGASSFPMSNPLAMGGMNLGGMGGGGMGGFGMMGGGGGGGGGQGGPYVYEVDDDDDEEESGGGLGGLFSQPMMAMLPMAGLAFLGGLTFSSLSSMVLDVLNGLAMNPNNNRGTNVDPSGTSRQRRDIPEEMLYKLHQIDTFRKVLASMPEKKIYDSQLAAKYLSCSGLADDKNLCLERAACEFTNSNSTVSPLHKDALSMTVTYILKNDFVPQGIKERIRRAASFGREGTLDCKSYFPCKPAMFT